jgi:hypothetical protein
MTARVPERSFVRPMLVSGKGMALKLSMYYEEAAGRVCALGGHVVPPQRSLRSLY